MTVIAPTTPEAEVEAVPDEPPFDPMAMLASFNNAMGVKAYIEEPDAYGRQKALDLRIELIEGEFREVMDELLDIKNGQGSYARLAKEISDLHYVLYQAEALFDIPAYAVFREVHRSNMSKLGPDGKPVLSPSGKVTKGPNYSPADIESILADGVSS